jgi:hypothetical protein
MSRDAILNQLYRLKAHPFSEVYDAPLDPRDVAGARLRHYFDLYDWSRSPMLHAISDQDVFDVFPDEKVIGKESILILIAGSDQTGRESLRNLILYKIARRNAASIPLAMDIDLEEGDRAENVRLIAQLFPYTYALENQPAPTTEALTQMYTQMTAAKPTGDKAYYGTLFQLWRKAIDAHCKRPLVLTVKGLYQYNTLRVVFNSTRPLFQYVIVLTENVDNAESCRKLLVGEHQNVVLVESSKLTRERAERYLRDRLKAERLSDPEVPDDSLLPFSAEALDALYKGGATLLEGEEVVWRVEFINRTLKFALDQQLGRAEQAAAPHGTPHERSQWTIGSPEIQQARQAIQKTGGL